MRAFWKGFWHGINCYDNWPRWLFGIWCAGIGFVLGVMHAR